VGELEIDVDGASPSLARRVSVLMRGGTNIMDERRLFSAAFPWLRWGLNSLAAPGPASAATPISVENAHQVRAVDEIPKRVHRILRGPGRNQLTLLELWNAIEVVEDADLRTVRTIGEGNRSDVAVSPDGNRVAWTQGGGAIYTVQETAGDESFQIEVGNDGGRAAFSPHGDLLAIGHTIWFPNAEGEGESRVKLFDVSGKLVRTLEPSGPGYLTPVFSPDGKMLAVGNLNYETRLFDVFSGTLLHALPKRGTREIAFSPDGKTLAAAYVDGSVATWDVEGGKLLRSRQSGCTQVFSLDWSPKGDVLVTGGQQGKIVLWDPQKLSKLQELEALPWVFQVRFTTDGVRLLGSSAAGNSPQDEMKVTVWAVPDNVAR
jgi:WD40 repeat protein